MVEIDKAQGGWDATEVQVPQEGVNQSKTRQAISIADPYVLDARLRLALVNGNFRLPTSDPLISDNVVANGEKLTSILNRLLDTQIATTNALQGIVRDLKLMNLHLASITDEQFEHRDVQIDGDLL